MDRRNSFTISSVSLSVLFLLNSTVTNASDIAENTKAEFLRNGFIKDIGYDSIETTKDWVWVEGANITFAATSTADSNATITTMCFANHKACIAMFSEYGQCIEGDDTTLSFKTNLESRSINFRCMGSSNGLALYGTKPEQVDDLLYKGSSVEITAQTTAGKPTPRHFSLAGSSQALKVVFKAYERYSSSE